MFLFLFFNILHLQILKNEQNYLFLVYVQSYHDLCNAVANIQIQYLSNAFWSSKANDSEPQVRKSGIL
jgi:hypothetical protein